ncbi:MAG: TRAP transporter substrate-binding protein DctP [Sphaerochaetaceae bacterium]|nr:TRAP transporter substrate-binding protein DctP [Sphaerochaetaceae bacterium]
MKEKSVLLAVSLIILLFIILLFASVSLIFENTLFQTSHYTPRVHVELDRAIEDIKVVKISHPHPKSHPIHAALNEVLVPELKRVSGFAFQVELYPDNQLGGSESQLLGLMNTALELVVLPAVYLSRYDSMGIFSVPYMFSSYTEVSSFLDRERTRTRIEKDLERDGLMLLGWGFDGYRHIVRTGDPALSEEWTVGLSSIQESPLRHEFFQSQGYTPTYLEAADLTGLLRKAQIPFGEISTTQFIEHEVGGAIQTIEYPRYLSVPILFLTHKSFWDTLSVQEQNLIQKAVNETLHYANEALLALESSFLTTMDSTWMPAPVNEQYDARVVEYIEQMGFDKDL